MARLVKDLSPIKKVRSVTPSREPVKKKKRKAPTGSFDASKSFAAKAQLPKESFPAEKSFAAKAQLPQGEGIQVPTKAPTTPEKGKGFLEQETLTGGTRGEKLDLLSSITPVGRVAKAASIASKSRLLAGGLDKLKNIVKPGSLVDLSRTVIINGKKIEQTESIISRFFSAKTLAIAGAWAGATWLGLWGQAEAPEPPNILLNKFLIPEAQRTGDWSLVDETTEAMEEIMDLDIWEKIFLYSPLSAAVGIPNKIEGIQLAVNANKKFIEDQKVKQAQGLTEDQYWEQRRLEQAEQEKALIDYYNEQRKLQIQWEAEARAAQRDEDARFWAKQQADQRKKEAEDRQAIADFWAAYRRQAQIVADNNRPSTLNFGLL
jgi:hypothetical protein